MTRRKTKAPDTPVTINLSPELMSILPDLARLWSSRSDGDEGYYDDVVIPPGSGGGLEKMAGEIYDKSKNRRVSRETGMVMIASNLSDAARDAILAKVLKAAFGPQLEGN